jgi:16S rRNA (adenine1518-N6/adenine1519-N6)-dimethyltransferase
MNNRQTISFLRQRFAEAGIRPVTRHGQNFLVDLNLVRLLVDAARLDKHDVVLEVGTGTGSLTALLAAQAGAVVSVELDLHLHQLALEELYDTPNVTLLRRDVLKSKNKIEPAILELIEERMAQIPGSHFKLAANLPYNIATPVVSNLLSTPITPQSMTITIQKEVAERIMARPSSKDYGALSMWIQSQCEVELIRELPPTVFWPRPKVSSAIIQIRPQPSMRAAIADLDGFHSFVRAIFCHRRKLLRSELITSFKQLTKQQVDEILLEQGFAADARAEQLTWQQVLALSESVRRRS